MRSSRAFLVLLLGTLPAFGQGWTPTVRTEIRVVEDSNPFLQDEAPLQSGQTVRGEPVRADDEEFVATIALAAACKPAAGTHGTAFDLGYCWEWHRFSSLTQESHRDHRATAGFKRTDSEWVGEGKAALLHVDGGHEVPVYNELGGVPAMGGEPVRSRRAQTSVTASSSLLYLPANSAWRLRPNLTWLSQDFHTTEVPLPIGCANYVDRGQGLVGVDGGRVLQGDVIGWVSLRAGRQWQSNLLGRAENFTSTLIRPLVGLEGTLHPKLRVSAWAGPTFHRFTNERRAGTEKARMIPYFETTAAWSATKLDSINLSLRHHLWPGSGGRSAYREFKSDVGWTHRFANKAETGIRAGVLHGNFGGFAASPRNDNIFTLGANGALPLPQKFRAEIGVVREVSQTRVARTDGRAYHRWLTSLALSRLW